MYSYMLVEVVIIKYEHPRSKVEHEIRKAANPFAQKALHDLFRGYHTKFQTKQILQAMEDISFKLLSQSFVLRCFHGRVSPITTRHCMFRSSKTELRSVSCYFVGQNLNVTSFSPLFNTYLVCHNEGHDLRVFEVNVNILSHRKHYLLRIRNCEGMDGKFHLNIVGMLTFRGKNGTVSSIGEAISRYRTM